MLISHRRASAAATGFVLVGIMIAAPLVPAAVSSWLGVGALALLLWPLLLDAKSGTTLTVGHFGLIASCFALGVHDEHRSVWLTLLATFAVLPLAWAFRRAPRVAKGTAGLILAALTFGVFAWSTEHLDDGPLSALPQLLLLPTVAGIVMTVQALRPAKRSPAPIVAVPSPAPARPPWARDVTDEQQGRPVRLNHPTAP